MRSSQVRVFTAAPQGLACHGCRATPTQDLVLLGCQHMLCAQCFAMSTFTCQHGAMILIKCPFCEQAQPVPRMGYLPFMKEEELSYSELLEQQRKGANIAVVGLEGAGKSQLIATITGQRVCTGLSMESITQQWESYRTSSYSNITWWDSKGIECWDSENVLSLNHAIEYLEGSGVNLDLIIIVMRFPRKANPAILGSFLDELQRKGKRFLVVTTAMGYAPSNEWDSVRVEKRRLLCRLNAGRPTALNDNADIFVKMQRQSLFSCYIDSKGWMDGDVFVPEPLGVSELIICVLFSLPECTVGTVTRDLGRDWKHSQPGRITTVVKALANLSKILAPFLMIMLLKIAEMQAA